MSNVFLFDLDKKIFFFFQNLQNFKLDYFLAWPTMLGETVVALTIVTALILVIDRKGGYENIAIADMGILMAHWVSQNLKDLFQRPRPYIAWDHVHVIFAKPSTYSFPSGHTTIIFCAAFLLMSLYPKKMGWAWIVAVWIGLTRIYVGAHYPTDVLGGIVVGITCAIIIVRIFNKSVPSTKKN